MSVLDRLLRRGERQAATAEAVGPTMTEEEARVKRLVLWKEIRGDPTPERAAEIVSEATDLLKYFNRDHPMHDNINELVRTAAEVAGQERLFTVE